MSNSRSTRNRPSTRRRLPWRLECLEHRTAPATFTVTNLNNSGAGSLRQAILDANAATGADSINFLTSGTIALTTGQLTITGPLVIDGPGALVLTVQQKTANARVFDVTATSPVTIAKLTITGGNGVDGAGVKVTATRLSLQECIVAKNSGIDGGGAWASGANAEIFCTDTEFVSNTASGSGGGIYATNGAFAGYWFATMKSNRAANGGAIWIDNGELQIGWASIWSNTATFDGGAVNFQSPEMVPGTEIVNSTFAHNKSGRFGGALFLFDNNDGTQPIVPISHTTVANNEAVFGGGFFLTGSKASILNTVLAQNTATTDGADAYLVGGLSAQSSAIGTAPFVGAGDPLFAFNDLGGNLAYGIDLKLATLGDNVGPTLTLLPLPGSPLIDKGGASSLPNDQRFLPRPNNGVHDIGSVETQQIIVTTTADSGAGSLRQAIIDANSKLGPYFINFSPAAFSSAKTISLLTPLPTITERVYVNGTGADSLTVRRDPGAATTFRILTIANKLQQNVEISGMTITGGVSTVDGGGVLVDIDSRATFRGVTITGNSTSFDGGGIAGWQNSHINLIDSTVSGNSTGPTSNDEGGGIYSIGQSVNLENTLITGNKTNGFGGGIHMTTPDGLAFITNSTISGNSAAVGGGGVYLGDLTRFYLWSSTVTGNTAGTGAGGGIMRVPASAEVLDIYGSIVSGNVNATAADISAGGTIDVNYSAIGSAAGFTLSGSKNLAFGLNLELGPLGNNGGPTQTHLPALDSPLLDTGKDRSGGFYKTDQRGNPRQAGPAVDIGAVEVGRFIVFNANDSGTGSLRDALAGANAAPGNDLVIFDPTFFASKRTISLSTGELLISDSVTIEGPGQTLLTISGNSASRVFNINGPGTLVVDMSDLTIANGKVTGEGGGLLIDNEKVALQNCTITNNTASQDGGGIEMNTAGGILTLIGCTISNNSATGSTFDGGGIDVEATGVSVSITNSTISGNSTGGEGGGIFIANGSSLMLLNSAVLNNQAIGTGGAGVFIDGSTLASSIRNSTFSGNSATFSGGAINAAGTNAALAILNTTILDNTAKTGGGIHLNGVNSTLTLSSTVVSNNAATTEPDLFAAGTVNATVSLLGSKTGATIFNGDATSNALMGQDPKLLPLLDNGGPTVSMMPQPRSPLINVGTSNGLPTDQRGLPRSSFGADIGAVELQQLVVTNANDSGTGSLRTALTTANSQEGPDWVRFDAAKFATAQVISLLTALPTIAESLFLTGTTADRLNVRRDPAAVGNFRMLTLSGGTTEVAVTGMTISGGINNALGAGISVGLASALTLDGVVVSGNSSNLGSGGGIAVSAFGRLVVRNSTVAGNAIGNLSTVDGGGIAFAGSLLLIENSTISGNSAGPNSGGGLYVNSTSTATVTIRNSTITNNTATIGGGIARSATSTATIDIVSSIISGNTAPTDADISATGTINLNFSAVGSGIGFTPVGGNNLSFGADLKLDKLANNGGSTLTHALLAGSAAIDQGSNPAALPYDQRGIGFDRKVGADVDIGAFESKVLVAPPQFDSMIINNGAVQRSRVTSLKVIFDQIVTLPGNPANAFTLRRQSDGVSVIMSGVVDNSGPGTVVTFTFTGGASEFGSLTDGRFNLNILASQISGPGGQFDGNGDGTGGDNLLIVGNPATNKLYRLFGDADGDNDVDTSDFAAFRSVYGDAGPVFDFDNDGDVDTSDFAAFRGRYGVSI